MSGTAQLFRPTEAEYVTWIRDLWRFRREHPGRRARLRAAIRELRQLRSES